MDVRRSPGSKMYLMVIDLGSEDEDVYVSDLREVKGQTLYVRTSSVNAEHDQG